MSCNLIQIVQALISAGVIGQPSRSQVLVLMHMDSTPGTITSSAGVIDECGHSVMTYTANVSGVNKAVGAASIQFGGNGYSSISMSSADAIGTQDFTWEAWLYPTALNYQTQQMAGFYYSGPSNGANTSTSLIGLITSTGKVSFGNTGGVLVSTGDGAIKTGQWQHVALTRQGNILNVWINGHLKGSATVSNWNITDVGSVYLAYSVYQSNYSYYTGYIDEFRLTRGMAVYTSDFTPQTTPFILPAT